MEFRLISYEASDPQFNRPIDVESQSASASHEFLVKISGVHIVTIGQKSDLGRVDKRDGRCACGRRASPQATVHVPMHVNSGPLIESNGGLAIACKPRGLAVARRQGLASADRKSVV